MTSRESSYGGYLIISGETGKPVKLALQELSLTGRLLPIGASLQVCHVFRSEEDGPIEVVYAFVLPRDAALRGFRVSGKGFSIDSELRPTAEAVESYEDAIIDGSLASMLRQYKDGTVNLCVGNVRPGETVVVQLEILAGVELRDDGLRFRFPFTLAPTYQSGVRGVEIESGGGELASAGEFDRLLPTWVERADALHRVTFDLMVAMPDGVVEVGSPSHQIRVRREADGRCRVSLAASAAVPDRDLVLDIKSQGERAVVTGGLTGGGGGHFAVVLPSTLFGKAEARPRRLVFVVDRSGSMNGPALIQARQAVEACLGALSIEDQFGIVTFDNVVESMGTRLLDGSEASRDEARRFLKGIEARGGTELAAGFLAGAQMLGAEGGEVLVLTDGQVAETGTILASARDSGIRIHCLGIGSASQDRFLTLLARESGGVSRFVTPRERVDLAALELFTSIGRPAATRLDIDAARIDFAPAPPAEVFDGTPLVLFGELKEETEAVVHLSWDGSSGRESLDLPVRLALSDEAETVRLLQGSRLITDIEARGVSGETPRGNDRLRGALLKLSKRYGLVSQAMSLVAVVRRQGDQLGEIPKTQVVPVGMPQDVQFGAYFRGLTQFNSALPTVDRSIADVRLCMDRSMRLHIDQNSVSNREWQAILSAPIEDSTEDILVKLAGLMSADGGLPGEDGEERWVVTAIALLCFQAAGHTSRSGALRIHFVRLLTYLRTAPEMGLEMENCDQKRRLLEAVDSEVTLPGDWMTFARTIINKGHVDQGAFWRLLTTR